jgi:hypothetical protein
MWFDASGPLQSRLVHGCYRLSVLASLPWCSRQFQIAYASAVHNDHSNFRWAPGVYAAVHRVPSLEG